MGQSEIIEVLNNSEKPLSGKELAKLVGQSFQGAVSIILKKLLDQKEIKCIELDRLQAMKLYGSKRKLRLYYIRFNKSKDRTTSQTHSYVEQFISFLYYFVYIYFFFY